MKLNEVTDIGEIIKRTRKEKGMTLEDVNFLTGISVSALSKIERNPGFKRFENIYRILEILDLTIHIKEK